MYGFIFGAETPSPFDAVMCLRTLMDHINKTMVTFVEKSEEFKTYIMCKKPTIVDFTADWCGPCKDIAPLFEKLAMKHEKNVVCIKVNVDEVDEDVLKACCVESMPTFMVFKDGMKCDLQVNGADEPALHRLFQEASQL